LPFDSARSLGLRDADGADLSGAQTALAQFNANHPYLLFHKSAIPGIRKLADGNSYLRSRFAKLMSASSPRRVPHEPRAAIKLGARRLINMSYIVLTADDAEAKPALAQARSALDGFAAAASWKERPVIQSFLDCAEIAVAVALAYDWLYDRLMPRERRAIERAILRNVLEPARAAYKDPTLLWPKRRDNCTLVSNSGILIAALAVLRRHREISAELVQNSLVSSWNVFAALAPDGAWREGLSYWSLAMRYAGLMVAALESTLGESFGLIDRPGFAETGDFALHAAGPFGAAFNFGDSEQRFDASPLAWLAHRFGRPIDGWLLGDRGDHDGWHLPFTTIWPKRVKASPAALGLPTGKIFRSGDLACFRNTWSVDPQARPVYLAIKGGNFSGGGGAPPPPEDVMLHAQADAGTFIVDGARHRWVADLGSDDYDLPGYFDHGADNRSGRRWQYYRSQATGHNTLTIGESDQIPNAPASILGSCAEGDCKWVVLDLSAAYGKRAGAVRRGAALIGRQVVIQDELGPEICGDVVWVIHTSAEPIALAGSVAHFRLGEDRLTAHILEPATACFELALPPSPRSFALAAAAQRHGHLTSAHASTRVRELPRRDDDGGKRAAGSPIRRLQIGWPSGARRLTVALLPDCDGDEAPLPVTPLDHWLARQPVRLIRVSRRGYRARRLTSVERDPLVSCPTAKVGYSRPSPQSSVEHA
jgi:Heparinase II/III-like protein